MQLSRLPNRTLQYANKTLDLSTPQIMGILNVTPDSFSDGGQFRQTSKAIAHALEMMEQGATIIDIGGESTRPHADAVSVQEELDRVIPVVEQLATHDVVISIDTSSPEVIREAVVKGAHIWNDVRALKRPHAMQTAAELNIPVILMHMRGEPSTMNDLAVYQDVTAEVMAELQQRIDEALTIGIRKENIIIDPGFGFAKTASQNLQLLNEFWKLHELGYPILSALSRKRFIGEVLGGAEATERDIASSTAHLLSIQQGACMVRTHNVKVMSDTIKMWQAMNDAI
ncbi:dihydropteroate synthase [Acinetobacter marinus]|uniref:Dihydropteroate synthase n=1 Tax=Acinetobacter marinus TaxID=281375 RepID=A0A1G6J551_9GAMM|nr:dihydropteroate synthase [Acinetobacter marinus]SDC13870.1 dihydropteroate synthase [Acinetobacter marinus]